MPEWKQEAGRVSISRQMMEHSARLSEAYTKMLIWEMTASPEEKRAKAAERRAQWEAKWDEQTFKGLIGLREVSDYECDPEFELASRGDDYISVWTTQAKWDEYVYARDLLKRAVEAFYA